LHNKISNISINHDKKITHNQCEVGSFFTVIDWLHGKQLKAEHKKIMWHFLEMSVITYYE